MKNSFILFQNYREYFEDLTGDEAKELLFAIFDYEKTRVKPVNLSAKVGCYFLVIKQQLDKNYEEYLKITDKNRENGAKGGRPKKTQNNPKNPMGFRKTQKTQPNPKNLDIDIDIDIDNDIDKEKEIKKEKDLQPKQPVAVVKKSPQAVMCDYFKSRYKANTGLEYLAKAKDYTLLAELIKDYGIEQVRQRIEWLEVGCKNRVFWFTKTSGINSFTIGKLYSQWNEILPMLTEEQRRQQEQKKKEEESMKRVLANVQKLKLERESWKNE